MPVLSVIIPVYNCEKYLRDAVISILKQPCKDFEIIIVDDGSTDHSGQIADDFSNNKNVIVIHQNNKGVSAARNAGKAIAKGKYICFLDADDILVKNVFDNDVHTKLKEKDIDVYKFGYIRSSYDLKKGIMIPNSQGLFLRKDMNTNTMFRDSFCRFLYRRELAHNIDFPEGIIRAEDTAFLKLVGMKADSIESVDKYWFIYRNKVDSARHHGNNYDYILDEQLPAWDWAKRQCKGEDYYYFEGKIFSDIVEYIEKSTMIGQKPAVTFDKLSENACLKDIIEDIGKFWVNEKTLNTYKSFSKDPDSFYKTNKRKGLPLLIKQKLVKIKAGFWLYSRFHYKTLLKDYIDC